MTSNKFYLYKRPNGFWYIGYWNDGRRLWKSSETKSKSEALKVLQTFEEHLKQDVPKITFNEFVKEFCNIQANNLRKSTIERIYLQAFKSFEDICGSKILSAYSLRDVETFKRIRLEGCSPVTVNIQFRSALRGRRPYFALCWGLACEKFCIHPTQA